MVEVVVLNADNTPLRLRTQVELAAAIERLRARAEAEISALIPGGEVRHVGSTALPGGLTKGDIDLQVRVTREDFEAAARSLETLFTPREGPDVPGVRAFWAPTWELPLDVLLTVRNAPGDVPWRVTEVLRLRADIRFAFERLQRRFEGRPLGEYRAAKTSFFKLVLASRDFRRTWAPSAELNQRRPAETT